MNKNQSEVIDLMKSGWTLKKMWTFVGHDNKDVCYLVKDHELKKIHMSTFNSLAEKKIIEFDRHEARWDADIYRLTVAVV